MATKRPGLLSNFKLDVAEVGQGGLIGAAIGAIIGSGVGVFRSYHKGRNLSGKDLDPSPLNFDAISPGIIPLFVELAELKLALPEGQHDAWRKMYGDTIRACDHMFNVIHQVMRKEAIADAAASAEVEVYAQRAFSLLGNLGRFFPQGSSAKTDYEGISTKITEMLSNHWFEFRSSCQ